jgi:hypothetical protein
MRATLMPLDRSIVAYSKRCCTCDGWTLRNPQFMLELPQPQIRVFVSRSSIRNKIC